MPKHEASAGKHGAEGGRGAMIGSPNAGPSQAASYAVKSVSAVPLHSGMTGAGTWAPQGKATASFSKKAAK